MSEQRSMLPPQADHKSSQNSNITFGNNESQNFFAHRDKNLIGLQRAVADPFSASPDDILALQRLLGNRAVGKIIQAKLLIGPAGNQYEREADRMAEQVVSQTSPSDLGDVPFRGRTTVITPLIQQMPLQGEGVQAKPESIEGFEADQRVENRLAAQKGGGAAMPDNIRHSMETQFEADFSQVRIHTGNEAGRINRALNAEAFTYSKDIFMGEGRYQPNTKAGQKLLAHELTHVVQQSGHSDGPAPQTIQCWRPWGKKDKKEKTIGNKQPSTGMDTEQYQKWLKANPGQLSEKEKQLMGITEQAITLSEEGQEKLDNEHRLQQANEIEALGSGKGQEEVMHSHDETGDLAQMAEDPRLQSRYQVDRKSDQGNFFKRMLKSGKQELQNKKKLIRSHLPGKHSLVQGEDFDQLGEGKKEKIGRLSKTGVKWTGKKIAKAVPVLGSGMKMSSAIKEGKRQKVAEEISKDAKTHKTDDSMETPLLQTMSEGLVSEHKSNKVVKGLKGALGLLPSGPESKIAKLGVTLGSMGREALRDDRKARLEVGEAKTDSGKSNALGNLAKEDPKFARAMLEHLKSGQMSIAQELYLNKQVQEPEGDHTLKPSMVAKQGRQEKARLRERERMGASHNWSLEREKQEEKVAEKSSKQQTPSSSKKPKEYHKWLKEHPEKMSVKEQQLLGIDKEDIIPEAPEMPEKLKVKQPEKRENLLGKLLRSEEETWYD